MKKILIICSVSFTGVMILFSLLSMKDLSPGVDNIITLQVFTLTLSIALGMSFTEMLQEKMNSSSMWVASIIRASLSYILIFVEGILFDWFPLSAHSLLIILPIWLPVFLITYLIVYLTYVRYAEDINQSIKRKK